MKLLLAPDSFKGSMSSQEVIAHLRQAAITHFPRCEIIELPIADGGEGTVDALVHATGGTYASVVVSDPLGRPRTARYGIINGDSAVIEMAQASGLTLLAPHERNPLVTTTAGTGELIRAVLDEGYRRIIIGIGGSATNDGGIGAAQALGVSFKDEHGHEVSHGGGALARIAKIDLSGCDLRLRQSEITVICDVTNPLTGPRGASHVFGPQKGATPAVVEALEAGMQNYSQRLQDTLGHDVGSVPGAGAAGGLGAALMGLLGAKLKPGIETILDLVAFDQLITDVDLVVTGEGRIDEQTVFGKVPVGIAKRCQKFGVPVAAIVGGIGPGAAAVYPLGVDSIMSAVAAPMTLETAMQDGGPLLSDAADRMFRFIKLGMALKLKDKREAR